MSEQQPRLKTGARHHDIIKLGKTSSMLMLEKKFDAATARHIRAYFDAVAIYMENVHGNEIYQRAYRRAARMLRDLKPD